MSGCPTPDYFESELMPGKAMFACTRLSASLLVTSCAQNWKGANVQGEPPERLFRCRQCPIGALHAGNHDAASNPLRGVPVCSRCNSTEHRLIGGNVCVSCKNREYEVIKGKNAKGRFPSQHAPLERRCVRYVAGGRVHVLIRERTTCTRELIVEVLRDSVQRAVFGLGVGNAKV
jgi:hypothetical protein